MGKVKATVMWMTGDRVDGYYYVGIKGTDLRACEDGHPDFPERFSERNDEGDIDRNAEKNAQKCADRTNKQLKNLV